MATAVQLTPERTQSETPARPRPESVRQPAPVLLPWLRAQTINVTRHAAALRPFRPDEFGTGAEAPTAGHLQAVNKMICELRRSLLKMSNHVRETTVSTINDPSTARLQRLMRGKEEAHR